MPPAAMNARYAAAASGGSFAGSARKTTVVSKNHCRSQRATTNASPPLFPGPASIRTLAAAITGNRPCGLRGREPGALHQRLRPRGFLDGAQIGGAIDGCKRGRDGHPANYRRSKATVLRRCAPND